MADMDDMLRKLSGEAESADPLVSFLYELMRDHMTPGKVEELVRRCPRGAKTQFTNGWLATYAAVLAARLRDQPMPQMASPATGG